MKIKLFSKIFHFCRLNPLSVSIDRITGQRVKNRRWISTEDVSGIHQNDNSYTRIGRWNDVPIIARNIESPPFAIMRIACVQIALYEQIEF